MLRGVGRIVGRETKQTVNERQKVFSSGILTSVSNPTMAEGVCRVLSKFTAPASGFRNRRGGADPDAGRRAACQQGTQARAARRHLGGNPEGQQSISKTSAVSCRRLAQEYTGAWTLFLGGTSITSSSRTTTSTKRGAQSTVSGF